MISSRNMIKLKERAPHCRSFCAPGKSRMNFSKELWLWMRHGLSLWMKWWDKRAVQTVDVHSISKQAQEICVTIWNRLSWAFTVKILGNSSERSETVNQCFSRMTFWMTSPVITECHPFPPLSCTFLYSSLKLIHPSLTELSQHYHLKLIHPSLTKLSITTLSPNTWHSWWWNLVALCPFACRKLHHRPHSWWKWQLQSLRLLTH